ncbi:MAG TPA: DinB family protein [Thermoanaerobaculia bacterium]
MDASLSSAMSMFRTADHYMEHSLAGLPAEALTQRIGAANSILWTVGHVTVGRLRLLGLLGEAGDVPWQAAFGKGSGESSAPERPALADVLARWREASTRLGQKLEIINASELAAPSPYDLPVPDRTLLGVIHYYAFHEVYHLGQIASTRKALGHSMPRRTAERVVTTPAAAP